MTAANDAELTIDRLGSEGVGVARYEGRVLLVPDALPGERVIVRLPARGQRAIAIRRLTTAAQRVPAPCPHFGTCGGCALQNLAAPAYAAFKRRLITDALDRQDLSPGRLLVSAISPPGSRRRATLAARRTARGILLGFNEAGSDRILDLATCPVLAPDIVALLPPLRVLLATILPASGAADIAVTVTESGEDIGLVLARIPGIGELEAMAAFAHAQDLARLWWRAGDDAPVPAAQRRIPVIRFAGAAVTLPMGAFLQATREGEAALSRFVLDAVTPACRVADLHSGLGTFALALAAAGHSVHAVERDAAAVAALASAARTTGLAVSTERRDLAQRPLSPEELTTFDAVIFDPPRIGAKAQAEALAHAAVGRIIAISCNPASFARDAALLAAGGWRLDSVLPVDQFLWSAHVELAALFTRSQRPSQSG